MRPAAAFAEKGTQVFRRTFPPITRHRLALYCGGSGDHNPIHVDSDYAKASGYEDVFVHGMLVMAYLGRALTDCLPPFALRSYGVRFVAKTAVHAAITCEGLVDEANADGVRLKLVAKDETGEVKLTGTALIAPDVISTG
ncbi:MaoC/PaaZ C-terminal domain-containing protein [Bradyrhizobium sp. AUGA SZCCT0240]|uniref:MaoC/PaaZ C-terminal domain-containing protein n=1 Tax=Bradyrhizobium sp. AUGA SZCCT0240 TaxID=2807669 RepID=UPI002011802E|nr:MaoC/PaaZ C-terminal domain-containing protein [Bradyrhizobium sp. AUGA SZCCT0240]